MINVIEVYGSNFPASAAMGDDGGDLPEDVLANIPGWVAFLDPEYPYLNGLLNRVITDGDMQPVSAPIDLSGTIGGHPALKAGTALSTSLVTDFDWPATEGSFIQVIQTTDDVLTGGLNLVRPVDNSGTAKGPAILVRTNGTPAIYNTNVTVSRVNAASNNLFDGLPHLLVFTWSNVGLHIYVDGVLAATNGADTVGFQEKTAAGQLWMMGRNTDSDDDLLYGRGLVSSIDLSRSQNAAYLALITSTLKTYYGIA